MLTHHELKTIQDGHLRNDDMLKVLREVKRLRELATEAYGVLGFIVLTDQPPDVQAKAHRVCEMLRKEPAVQGYLIARKKREDTEYRRRAREE